jgi:hypothetical protein
MSGRLGLARSTVDELDHRVHDRLRVHHDVDPVQRDVEEQVRLDQLEPLLTRVAELMVTTGPCPRSGGPALARP